MKDDIHEIACFIMERSTYADKTNLQNRIKAHITYKTCRIIYDKDGRICAVCLWNIGPDGLVADVTDLVIRNDYRKKDIMRRILIDAMKIWPLKFIRYNRDYTPDGVIDRGSRMWSVERFLRRRA